jgi:hypothetical protein
MRAVDVRELPPPMEADALVRSSPEGTGQLVLGRVEQTAPNNGAALVPR